MGAQPSKSVRRMLKWIWFLLGLPAVFLTIGIVIGGVVMLRTERTPWLYQAAVDDARASLTGSGGRNAALEYWRNWTVYADEIDRAADRASWYIEDEPADPEERDAWLEDFQNSWDPAWGDRDDPRFLAEGDLTLAIDRLLVASDYQRCDFAPTLEEGIPALFPHLGPLRQSVKVLCADARRAAREGDPDMAVQRLGAALTTARRAEADRTVISSLVAIASVSTVTSEARALHAKGLITHQHSEQLAQRFADLADMDFGLRAALDTERRWHLIGIAMVSQIPYRQPIVEVSLRAFGSGSARAEEVNGFHDRLIDAWEGENRVVDLRRLQEEADRGAFGPLMEGQTELIVRTAESLERIRDQLREIAGLLTR
jgi:hypothetical protein